MKNKSTLLLVELLVMVLVFALAAALCLQAFTWAQLKSRENRDRDRAYVQLQTAAELLKHHRGDYDAAAAQLGGVWDGDSLQASCDEEGTFTLQALPVQPDTKGLAGALLQVLRDDGTVIAELTVYWQEVSP